VMSLSEPKRSTISPTAADDFISVCVIRSLLSVTEAFLSLSRVSKAVLDFDLRKASTVLFLIFRSGPREYPLP
jgi:hypothetical protein